MRLCSLGMFIGRSALLVAMAAVFSQTALAVHDGSYVAAGPGDGRFALASAGQPAPIVVSEADFPGVLRVAKLLQADIGRVVGAQPELRLEDIPSAKLCVIVGTLGKSPLVDQLVQSKKLDVTGVAGQWETFLVEVVENPLPGVDQALVIAGSDKRGTIYGMFDLSAQIGVTPWYWWADVPVRKQRDLYVLPGRHTDGPPAVKYRGIFINDEAPALAGWMQEKFGGCNHKFYAHVFELILRLKGNYLWPAMWGRAIYDDDPVSPQLAEEYGVVIGTTHHEPLMRAHVEWERYGEGPWNYDKNEAKLREFWTEGIQRMGSNESIVSIGMRGDGDEPMTQGANIALLERIVADQRKIIQEVTGKDPAEIPQLWALYKEVQEYYDKGMRVPEDVTLLLCDDNWGNIRKLPKPGDKPRDGGYGIYYHFDYVGGPRNYKWLNVTQISRVWEQMHLAYEHGVDRIWIVNVGDIKPMEYPIEFFLDYAWNPDNWPLEKLPEYARYWSAAQFGEQYASEIADILTKYTSFNSRRTPEMLSPDTYSLVDYREADTVVDNYNELASQAESVGKSLPQEYKDAYFQLVLFPVQACANLNELYVTTAKNRLYAKQGRAETNELAQRARELFARDSELTRQYHEDLDNGKWNHMMSQNHIGYTYWQEPLEDVMPTVEEIDLADAGEMGVAVEGSKDAWPGADGQAVLPEISRAQSQARYIDVFNRGKDSFNYTVKPGADWLKVGADPESSQPTRSVEKQQRLWVDVDWENAPSGVSEVPITITGPDGQSVEVTAKIRNESLPDAGQFVGFVEANGYVSIESVNATKVVDTDSITWRRIPQLGREHSAITTFPVTAEAQSPGGDSPRLEYRMRLHSSGKVRVQVQVSPTLNYYNTTGFRYAISIDDQKPQFVNIHPDASIQTLERWEGDHVNVTTTTHQISEPGDHVLKYWMVDSGIVLQKLIVDAGGLKPSYLGPPQSALVGE